MMARSLAAVFLDELAKHRALAPELADARITVAFTIVRHDGSVDQCTALLEQDGTSRMLPGSIVLPGSVRVSIASTEQALRSLLSGERATVDVEGDPAVTAALSACFRSGKNALSVRLGK